MPEKKNIKKLVLKSQYVNEEHDETKEKMSKYREEFYKAFPEEYKQMLEKQNNQPEQNNEILEDEGEEEIKDSHPQADIMKSLYRRITKITHPDKVDSEFLTSYFKKASTAYGEEDVAELFVIASVLNIDVTDIESDSIATKLEDSIITKQFETSNMKNSLAWAWSQAKTEKQKEAIRTQLAEYIKKNY